MTNTPTNEDLIADIPTPCIKGDCEGWEDCDHCYSILLANRLASMITEVEKARDFVSCYKNLMDDKHKKGHGICGAISVRCQKWLKDTEG